MKNLPGRLIWLIIIVPAIYLGLVWKKVPQTVATHFNIEGKADSFSSKNNFLFVMAFLIALNAVVYLIVTNIYKIDPKKYAAQNKDRLQKIAFSVSMYLSAISIMIVYQAIHNNPDILMKFVFIAMGLLFALLGNNMYNLKPNYFAGIRLPWTLENEENWRKTHHLAGRLWFFGGLFFAIISFVLNSKWAGYTSFLILALLILIPVIYSYRLYRAKTEQQ